MFQLTAFTSGVFFDLVEGTGAYSVAIPFVSTRKPLPCWQNNPDDESLEARLLQKLKNDPRNNGKILVTLEHIAEWQPTCWERRHYKYSS